MLEVDLSVSPESNYYYSYFYYYSMQQFVEIKCLILNSVSDFITLNVRWAVFGR